MLLLLQYLSELVLLDYSFIESQPSLTAAAIVYTVLNQYGLRNWVSQQFVMPRTFFETYNPLISVDSNS